MRYRSVHRHELSAIWPRVAAMVAAADLRGRFGDVGPDLAEGRKLLWLAEGDDMLGAAVTCITDFPEKRVCTILLCGGTDLDQWQPGLRSLIEDYAQQQNCEEIEIIGRPGWHRICPDYELAGLWLVKGLRPLEAS